MTRGETEAWLAALQARFGAVLRTPLSAAGGTLHSDPLGYPSQALDDIAPSSRLTAAERLGVYQRQYWMRLLNLLQDQYPLTMRLCGAWDFNQLGIAFLQGHAPRGYDLGWVADSFAEYLEAEPKGDVLPRVRATPLPLAMLREAARIDAAFRRVFMAPEEPAFQLTPQDVETLDTRRLRFSLAFARVSEHHPLLALRARILGAPDSAPVDLPEPLPQRQTWALQRSPRGVAHAALSVEQARLFELLEGHSVGDALAILEVECEPSVRAGLPERTRKLFALAVQRGYFTGFV